MSPHTRGAISAEVHRAGHWRGSRRGVKMDIRLGTIGRRDKRVSWRARLLTKPFPSWIGGTAGTVYDAINEIEDAFLKTALRTEASPDDDAHQLPLTSSRPS